MPGNIKNVMAAIDYIESHLREKLDLDTVAGAVHYSKYYLHRMFTDTIGLKLLGENGVAAITIMIYTQFFLSAFYIGFSMGVAPVLSYNYGKQDEKQLKNVFSICMRIIGFVSISVFAMAFLFGSPLVGIFAKKGTPVYGIAQNGFLIFPFSFLFCELNIFTSATFTTLSNGKLSAVLSFLRTFGLITVLLLTLPNVLGVTGVWLAVPIAEFITMIVALVFLHQNKEKYHYA